MGTGAGKNKLNVYGEWKFFCVLPVKNNKIVFDSYGGRGYGCDPKYITEELLSREEELDMVWLVQGKGTELPEGVRLVKYGGVRALYELATAKVWVDNFKSALRVPKKKNQYYIQTWHSSMGLKKNEADADNLDKSYVRRAKNDAKATDLMYSNNAFREEKYRHRFWYNGEVIRCGHPRNGILINTPEQIKNKVREYFHLSKEKKILLYAPTFRSKSGAEVYKSNMEECLEACKKRFGGDFVCLLRLHPNVAGKARELDGSGKFISATEYPDMQELMATADILVTDYSGSMFEFMITGKPVFLLTKDFKEYLAKERELYFPIEELPFPTAQDEPELCKCIVEFDAGRYQQDCRSFMKRIDMKEDGCGARVLADIILEKIHSDCV